jgi:hypothetical protein
VWLICCDVEEVERRSAAKARAHEGEFGEVRKLQTPEYFQGLWGDRNTANFDELQSTSLF